MKILLVAARSNPEAFAERFRAELSDHEVLTELPGDGRPIAYAVVGKPPPGMLRGLHGLELVLSLNAGVEHLLASGEVPDAVPIVRMVDPGLVEGMVEWVAAQVLAAHRNLFDYRAKQFAGRWVPAPEKLARERTVTVLGAGALGGAVATALAALRFQVRVWSRGRHAIAGVASFAGADELAVAAQDADFLVNLLPATPLTTDLIDAALLARLAPGAFLVNGGRGAAIVDADLLAALDGGALGGCALDVFREEPLPAEHPFWRHPRVSVSPHVAAPTHVATSVAVMAESVRQHERGETPSHVVDRARGY